MDPSPTSYIEARNITLDMSPGKKIKISKYQLFFLFHSFFGLFNYKLNVKQKVQDERVPVYIYIFKFYSFLNNRFWTRTLNVWIKHYKLGRMVVFLFFVTFSFSFPVVVSSSDRLFVTAFNRCKIINTMSWISSMMSHNA